MDRSELEKATKEFALGIVRFVSDLPKTRAADVMGYQLLKSGTSIGANYREAGRAESRADFIHKMAVVEKETSETQYWLELCRDAPLGPPNEVAALYDKATQLLAIFTASSKTAKKNKK
jgi:four helix bundle protein